MGTYHFDNPNQDQFNVKSDNIFSDKRQKEIELLVKQLAKFNPTHIALEFNAADSALNEKYRQVASVFAIAFAQMLKDGYRQLGKEINIFVYSNIRIMSEQMPFLMDRLLKTEESGK